MSEIKIEDFSSPQHEAKLFILKNDELCVKITNYGAAITAILMKDRQGKVDDIVIFMCFTKIIFHSCPPFYQNGEPPKPYDLRSGNFCLWP